jgi:glycosyltransferase involved in cell wall biosynthesis
MRLLQVIDSLRIGGAEVLVRNMAPRLRQRGIDCEVLVLSRSQSSLEVSLQRDGIKVVDTGDLEIYSPRQVPILAKMIRGFDLVHVHLFPAQLWVVLAAQLQSDSTLVTTEHNTVNARRRWWLRPMDAWMYRQYSQIACNSNATAAELARWCPRVKDKLKVVPNGIPLQAFSNAEGADLSGLGDGKIKAVFVSRFEPQKDHVTLFRAIQLAPRVHLFLLGDGPLRAQLEQLASDLGIASRVSFLGFRNDVAQVLKACDVYVHSTTSDGFGIAACEAMGAGLPVIASDVPGLAQVVQGAGVLTPMGNHERLAQELNILAESEEKRHCMSQASRRRALDFNIERTVEKYIEMYQEVLQSRPRKKVWV